MSVSALTWHSCRGDRGVGKEGSGLGIGAKVNPPAHFLASDQIVNVMSSVILNTSGAALGAVDAARFMKFDEENIYRFCVLKNLMS